MFTCVLLLCKQNNVCKTIFIGLYTKFRHRTTVDALSCSTNYVNHSVLFRFVVSTCTILATASMLSGSITCPFANGTRFIRHRSNLLLVFPQNWMIIPIIKFIWNRSLNAAMWHLLSFLIHEILGKFLLIRKRYSKKNRFLMKVWYFSVFIVLILHFNLFMSDSSVNGILH